jgi:hypothetical protein
MWAIDFGYKCDCLSLGQVYLYISYKLMKINQTIGLHYIIILIYYYIILQDKKHSMTEIFIWFK